MYSSYTAEQLARTYELADRHGVNLMGAVTWAFEFEDQPYFAGFRDLGDQRHRQAGAERLPDARADEGRSRAVDSSGALSLEAVREHGVGTAPDVSALASADAHSLSVLVWNYHDDDLPAAPAEVSLAVTGIPSRAATMTHYRVDDDHSNAYAAWLRMGSPASLTAAQHASLVQTGQLGTLTGAAPLVLTNGGATLSFSLPRQAVSLVSIVW